MDLTDLISPNAYVGENFPMNMPPAADGNGDALGKLKELLFQRQAELAPEPSQAPGGLPVAPQPIPNAAPMPSGPTDFSARARSVDVPLPMPRPAEAPQPMTSPMLPPQMPQFQQNAGDLRSAIMGQPTMASRIKNAMASLGGGLSTVEGNTAGGAFARGAGGALKAGTANERADFNDAIKALKDMREAAAAGDQTKYKQALTAYYNQLNARSAQEMKASADGTKPGKASPQSAVWGNPQYRFDRMQSALLKGNQAIDNEYVNDPRARASASPADKAALAAEIKQRKDAMKAEYATRYGVGDNNAAAPSPGNTKKAGKPGELSFNGDGTEAAPYEPMNADDFAQVESGAFYRKPNDPPGKYRQKP